MCTNSLFFLKQANDAIHMLVNILLITHSQKKWKKKNDHNYKEMHEVNRHRNRNSYFTFEKVSKSSHFRPKIKLLFFSKNITLNSRAVVICKCLQVLQLRLVHTRCAVLRCHVALHMQCFQHEWTFSSGKIQHCHVQQLCANDQWKTLTVVANCMTIDGYRLLSAPSNI